MVSSESDPDYWTPERMRNAKGMPLGIPADAGEGSSKTNPRMGNRLLNPGMGSVDNGAKALRNALSICARPFSALSFCVVLQSRIPSLTLKSP
jgi:hypothetical protein